MVIARSFDGSGNNLKHPEFNSVAGSAMARFTDPSFADGISQLRDGPNPRDISNIVVGQGNADVETPKLSGFLYAWGQFIDHDLDLNRADQVNHIDITIPQNDQHFPPGSVIPVTRGTVAAGTGAGTHTPAAAVNAISGWMDASQVYGSGKATSDSLRVKNPDGTLDAHLATSAGDNLPIVNGNFAAGDVRVNENSALTAVHTLFLREHNRQVDAIEHDHPNWTQEHVFQQARAIVAGEIQNITFDEYLPAVLGKGVIDKDRGYNPNVDARITEEFAGAAFRFGHSTVSADITKIANDGTVLSAVALKDDFGRAPDKFVVDGGADAILRNLASEHAQAMDARVIDDLRDFLIDGGPPSDLASINIDRGRDFGLAPLNEIRAELGLHPYKHFGQITSDKATVAALKEAYHGDINAVDFWVGGIAEEHRGKGGGVLGQTFTEVLERQFENLRDGDRLWFSRDGLDKHTVKAIDHTTLSDVILANTDTDQLQKNAFIAHERAPPDAAAAATAAVDTHAPAKLASAPADAVLDPFGHPLDAAAPASSAVTLSSSSPSSPSASSSSPPLPSPSDSSQHAPSEAILSPATAHQPDLNSLASSQGSSQGSSPELHNAAPAPTPTVQSDLAAASHQTAPLPLNNHPTPPPGVETSEASQMLKLVVSEGQLLAQNGPTHPAPESLPPGLLTQEAIHFTPEVMQALSGSPPASGAGPGSSPASGQPAAGQVSVLVNPHSDTFQFAPELLNGPSLHDAKAGPAVHASPAPDHTLEMIGLQPILPVDHGLLHA